MNLRKHQAEFAEVIEDIIQGSETKTILCKVVPGGGKSLLPVIAAKLIGSGLAQKLAWVVPRISLQEQAERSFMDPFFRQMIGHERAIRSSTNDEDPSRGLTGFSTTFNAIGMDNTRIVWDFHRYRYVLVLDEFHHCELNGVWHKALQPLVDNCAFLVLMTGTCARSDNKRIAFMPYVKERIGGKVAYTPDLATTDDLAVVEYSRTDALEEKAILPLEFHLLDGHARWVDTKGIDQAAKLSVAEKKLAPGAIYTCINTEYADKLLSAALENWAECRQSNPNARLLVVASDIEHAEKTYCKLRGYNAGIATSEDSAAAQHEIRRLKAGAIDILVSVCMVYEGLDVPSATHIACLTNIRALPWIEQMVARVVRIDRECGLPYEAQAGFIFAPDDTLMREIVQRIQLEQLPFIQVAKKQKKLFKEVGSGRNGIDAQGSEAIGFRKIMIGNGNGAAGGDVNVWTPSQEETSVRKAIEQHVRLYAHCKRQMPYKINSEIRRRFGKARADMTMAELKQVLHMLRHDYPITTKTRARRPRVPTKAVRVQ